MSGDVILAEIETDKATMEFEAVDVGQAVGEILVAEGTEGVKPSTAPIADASGRGLKTGTAMRPPRRLRPARSAEGLRITRSVARCRYHRCTAKRSKSQADQPEIPERQWGEIHQPTTVREALARRHGRRNARATRTGVPDGRGSRPVSGRLQDQPGPAAGIRRASRVIDTPITEHGFTGLAYRGCL